MDPALTGVGPGDAGRRKRTAGSASGSGDAARRGAARRRSESSPRKASLGPAILQDDRAREERGLALLTLAVPGAAVAVRRTAAARRAAGTAAAQATLAAAVGVGAAARARGRAGGAGPASADVRAALARECALGLVGLASGADAVEQSRPRATGLRSATLLERGAGVADSAGRNRRCSNRRSWRKRCRLRRTGRRCSDPRRCSCSHRCRRWGCRCRPRSWSVFVPRCSP